jgi:mannose-6-phosphate isomerase-like protein (cupin superfamily)
MDAENERELNVDELIDSCIARAGSRYADWETLSFQAKAGDQYRRAQIRYIGSGATGNHETDGRILPPGNFTFSNMLLPPGGIGPEHVHHDAEEVFFVLEGTLRVSLHDGERIVSRDLGYRDLVRIPPGVPRSIENIGTDDALFCVIIGSGRPQLPTYPETSPVSGVTRD